MSIPIYDPKKKRFYVPDHQNPRINWEDRRPEVAYLIAQAMDTQSLRSARLKKTNCGIFRLNETFGRNKSKKLWAILEKRKGAWKTILISSKTDFSTDFYKSATRNLQLTTANAIQAKRTFDEIRKRCNDGITTKTEASKCWREKNHERNDWIR